MHTGSNYLGVVQFSKTTGLIDAAIRKMISRAMLCITKKNIGVLTSQATYISHVVTPHTHGQGNREMSDTSTGGSVLTGTGYVCSSAIPLRSQRDRIRK